jgi:hypothetical protein
MCYSWIGSEVLAPRRVKREAGENPARSRHCEQRAIRLFEEPLFLSKGTGRLPVSR